MEESYINWLYRQKGQNVQNLVNFDFFSIPSALSRISLWPPRFPCLVKVEVKENAKVA